MTTDTLSLKKTGEATARKSNTTGYRIKHKVKKQRADASSAGFAIERHKKISKAAYYRAEKRGFQAGYEVLDWLEAEDEIDSSMEEAVTAISA